jgi:hypothetical protein
MKDPKDVSNFIFRLHPSDPGVIINKGNEISKAKNRHNRSRAPNIRMNHIKRRRTLISTSWKRRSTML